MTSTDGVDDFGSYLHCGHLPKLARGVTIECGAKGRRMVRRSANDWTIV